MRSRESRYANIVREGGGVGFARLSEPTRPPIEPPLAPRRAAIERYDQLDLSTKQVLAGIFISGYFDPQSTQERCLVVPLGFTVPMVPTEDWCRRAYFDVVAALGASLGARVKSA